MKLKLHNYEKLFIVLYLIFTGLFSFLLHAHIFSSISNIVLFLLILVIIGILVYLSYTDFKSMEIHKGLSLGLALFLAILNLLLFIKMGPEREVLLLGGISYSPYQNLIAAVILGVLIFIPVVLSKETYMGLGDVYLGIIIGLIIGVGSLWPWLNITIFSALFYGIILAYRKKKFKGTKIPLVPFMVLGLVTVIISKIIS